MNAIELALDLALDVWETQNLYTGVPVCGVESDGVPFKVWSLKVCWPINDGFPDRQLYEMAMQKLRNDARGEGGDGSCKYRVSPPKHGAPTATPGGVSSVLYCRMVPLSANDG